MSIKNIGHIAFLLLLPAVVFAADGNKRDKNEPRVVSGMSIVGNDETTKSLYIVPWKSSDGGKEIKFTSSTLNDELKPIDKDDFIRKLDLYRSRNPN